MRILIDLSRNDAGIEGVVSAEGSDPAARFSGWLELMALLDALWVRSNQKGERDEGGEGYDNDGISENGNSSHHVSFHEPPGRPADVTRAGGGDGRPSDR